MIHAALHASLVLLSGAGAPAGEPSDGWLSLDREIAALQDAAATAPPPIVISGYIKTSYVNSDDFLVGGEDKSGFELNNARINIKGKVGDYELRFSADFASSGNPSVGAVRDAFIRFPVAEQVHLQMGNFKSPFLFGGLESDELQVFYERTSQGRLWSGRELGLMADAQLDKVWLYAAVQNGGDAQADEYLFVARALFAIAGDAITRQSGGYGLESPVRATISAGWLSDETVDDAQVINAEAMLTTGRLWLHGEILDYGDGFADAGGNNQIPAGNAQAAFVQNDTTPFGVTAAYMLNSTWELAVRFEDLDDSDDTIRMWGGVNIYIEGHPAKWQVSYITTDSDSTVKDGDEVRVGLVVAI